MVLFSSRTSADTGPSLAPLLAGYSIEVTPRTAARIPDFRAILPAGTRIYIAHIQGTPPEEMIQTARRITDQGFAAMPHFPARLFAGRRDLAELIAAYRDAGVRQGLLLAGGVGQPLGEFKDSMQLLDSDLFSGFERLHVAGHPEGSRDIDPDGSDRAVMQALRWKAAFAERSDAQMALVTQFAFDAAPVIAWVDRLAAEEVNLPVHLGIAGPAKLQTLLKFALSCGVGPSLRVLQRRARDVTKLLLPYTPAEILSGIARHKAAHPDFGIAQLHLFPLGGIEAAAAWAKEQSDAA